LFPRKAGLRLDQAGIVGVASAGSCRTGANARETGSIGDVDAAARPRRGGFIAEP
jgi:hypothetical protein